MSELRFKGKYNIEDNVFHVGLSLIEFKEDDVTIIFLSALNLSGYGYTPEEASVSFPELWQF